MASPPNGVYDFEYEAFVASFNGGSEEVCDNDYCLGKGCEDCCASEECYGKGCGEEKADRCPECCCDRWGDFGGPVL